MLAQNIKTGETINFASVTQLQAALNVTKETIRRCLENGTAYKKTWCFDIPLEPETQEINQNAWTIYNTRQNRQNTGLQYGDSALNPRKIFYKGDAVSAILVRLNDKISRIENNPDEMPRFNDVADTIGYCTLLLIAMNAQPQDFEALKD